MSKIKVNPIVVSTLALCSFAVAVACADNQGRRNQPSAQLVDGPSVERMVSGWPERPRLGANQMMVKYGPPEEATSEKLVWRNQGRYKRIVVTRMEIPHDFPKPHMDFMQHTIAYRVPSDQANALTAFDGSATLDRTAGELSARCDLEGHNILTLNLSHDLIMGKKSVEQARTSFGDNVAADVMGKYPSYVTALRFEASAGPAADPDVPVIAGSPKRVMNGDNTGRGGRNGMSDGEILGFVIAVDDNEVLAGAEARKKKISARVKEYAKMLHEAHGKHLVDSMMLGQRIGVTPLDTPAVDKLRVKGAGELAMLVPLDSEKFERAFLAAMVKGHTEALEMIDNQLLTAADNETLKKHLRETRGHIAHHLEEAKQLHRSAQR